MDRERLDGWCERGIVAMVLAILVFGPLATGAVRTLEFLVIQGLTAGVVLLWMVRLWLRPRPQFLMPPMGWAVLAFAAYAVAAWFMADIEYVARLELLRVVIYALLYFAILNNLHRQETVNLVGYTLVFLAMAISFYAGYQFFTGDDRVWHFTNAAYRGRGTGTYINPNHLAGFLEMVLPLAIAYTIAGRMKPVLRIFLGYSAVVILAGIGLSLSRGGWLATGLALLFFFLVLLFHRGYRLASAAALAAIVLGAAALAPKSIRVQQRAEAALQVVGEREYSRYLLWRPAVRLWQENTVFGIGPGHFDYRFRSVRPQEVQLRPDRAHNDYLNALVDWGIVGLVIIGGAMVSLVLGIRKCWRSVGGAAPDLGSRRSNRFAFVLGGSFGLLAIGFHSMVDFNMQIPANAILAVTLMALLSSHLRFATERYWFNARRPVVVGVTLLLLAGLATLGWTGVRRAKEYIALDAASRKPSYSNAQADALQRAFAVEPNNGQTAYEIGECYRVQSWEGGDDYAELARKAITWFERAAQLNPHDGYSRLRHGMCLDWLGEHDEAWPHIQRAEELDPNGYYTVAHVGWHYVQAGNFAAARPWFERSIRLQWNDNPIAHNYLDVCNRRLQEAASEDDLMRALRQGSLP